MPTSEEVAVQKAMARLTAGDNVCIRSDGERDYFEAEVSLHAFLFVFFLLKQVAYSLFAPGII